MTSRIRFAFTADLHWGIRPAGDAATAELVAYLSSDPPDVLVLAGDIGAGDEFGPCLRLFANLPCVKSLVPGNHDIWVIDNDARGDSLAVYREHLPRVAAASGFHYLDHGPLVWQSAGVSLVGTINWYDYTWALEELSQTHPDWQERLRTKRFSRGRHNDARFVRWPLDDVRFTHEVVSSFETQLLNALAQVPRAIAVTHHPAFCGIAFPRQGQPRGEDALLWDAFAGNRGLEALLQRHAQNIPFVFSGHTHRATEKTLGPIRGFNLGGDYHFKRLLLLDWPAGTIEVRVFGRE